MPGLKRLMLACGAVVALGLCLWIGINYAFTEQLPWQSSDGAAAVILHQAAAAGLPTHGSTLPQRTAEPAKPMAGAPPLASADAPAVPSSGEGGRTLPPEMLRGMLQAARQSLFAGRPQEASAAYQAVLKRDPQNVDALTHLGLLLVMSADGAQRGELVDHGLRLFDRALGIDPNYPPALFYRGQVLYDLKHDAAGAIASWEKFVAVAPPGEDRDRVAKQIADAKAAKPTR